MQERDNRLSEVQGKVLLIKVIIYSFNSSYTRITSKWTDWSPHSSWINFISQGYRSFYGQLSGSCPPSYRLFFLWVSLTKWSPCAAEPCQSPWLLSKAVFLFSTGRSGLSGPVRLLPEPLLGNGVRFALNKLFQGWIKIIKHLQAGQS